MRIKIGILVGFAVLVLVIGVIALLNPASAHASVPIAAYSGNCRSSHQKANGPIALSVSSSITTNNGVMSGHQSVTWSAPRRVHVVIHVGSRDVKDVVQSSGNYARRVTGPGTCITSIRITGSL